MVSSEILGNALDMNKGLILKLGHILIPLLLLFILAGCGTGGDDPAGSCEDVQRWGELSYGMAYCQGDFCSYFEDENGELSSVTTEEECEAIDVVVEGNIEKWGQDGEGDCQWIEEPLTYCAPNK